MSYQPHLHLEHNTIGNDYIIGDLHGHFDELEQLLELINFDKSKDRLFSVGDLIDRGPKSLECAELIYEPWFFMSMGNHELMMVQSIIHNDSMYQDCWMQNGGEWATKQPSSLLFDIAFLFAHQPLVISVGSDDNRFNICHAELTHYNHYHEIILVDNSFIDEWKFNKIDEDNILWGRDIINTYHSLTKSNTQFHSKDLSLTYVGHSFSPNLIPTQIQQHMYIDTGAAINKSPTIINPITKQTFTLNTL